MSIGRSFELVMRATCASCDADSQQEVEGQFVGFFFDHSAAAPDFGSN